MKRITTILLVTTLVVTVVACVSQPKLQYYEMPADMAEEARVANLKRIEKGRILYNINCAKCHNTREKGKIIIPDFTPDQLESYTIRIKNETHTTALPENRVTAEELEAIQYFFTYKKPGKPVIENK